MDKQESLKWRFDVSTFRLIGRDLITDNITALFELVKNCYDANASNVTITFENIAFGELSQSSSKITIEDDGIGMSFEDIRDKWMVIGTSNKRRNPYSPEPMHRKCVGEKGIGRFAVDKLGDNVIIYTKTKNNTKQLKVEINWNEYANKQKESQNISLFTDIENAYSYIDGQDLNSHGTKIVISDLHGDLWDKSSIEHLIREISSLVSPFANLKYKFGVRVVAKEFGIDIEAIKTLNEFDIATAMFHIGYNNSDKTQECIKFNETDLSFCKDNIPIKSFGGISMRVYYFDESARRIFRKMFPNEIIDGFKVYRDGIIATPFADSTNDPDKRRDVLGIDKRIWQDIFSRISSREFLGIIDISRDENPNIIDATNRQDFVDNKEYNDFKDFVIEQLGALQKYKVYDRQQKKKVVTQDLQNATDDINQLIDVAKNVVKTNPVLKEQIDPLIRQATKTSQTVKTAIKEHKKAEEEFSKKESVYLSIMSLQEYAIHITHAVRTTLNQIRDRVEYFYDYFPDDNDNDTFILYAKQMYEKFQILNKVIDFMLSYSQSNLSTEEINLGETITEILEGYDDIFEREGIRLECDIPSKFIHNTNRQFFRDILQNLVDNSIKALCNSSVKVVKCSCSVDDKNITLKVSDTGCGIPKESWDNVFALYYTTTEKQGGAGVGLYIVKTRVESLKGTVCVTDSDFGEIGTTIKITIPLKK